MLLRVASDVSDVPNVPDAGAALAARTRGVLDLARDPRRGAEHEAAVTRHEPGVREPIPKGRLEDGHPVHAPDHELTLAAVADELTEAVDRDRRDGGVVEGRERLEGPAASLEVQRGTAIDEDNRRAGRPGERPPIGIAASRPGNRGAIRVGRVG